MAADIQTLLHSPDFQSMTPADQQATAAQVESDFGGLSPEDFLATVKAAQGQAPAIPTVPAGDVQGANPKPPSAPTLSSSEEMPVSQAEVDSRQTGEGKIGTMKELGVPAAIGLAGGAGAAYGSAAARAAAPLGRIAWQAVKSVPANALKEVTEHPLRTLSGAAELSGFLYWLAQREGKGRK